MFLTCVRVNSNNPRYECFSATDMQCVVQKERPFDLLQAPPELIPTAAPTTTSTTTTSKPAVVSPLLQTLFSNGALPPNLMSSYNPNLYGPGIGMSTSGLGFNMNLNYNPLMGWGVNSNLALETPWSTMLAPLLGLPMIPTAGMPFMPGMGLGLPGMGMGMLGTGMGMPGMRLGMAGMGFQPMMSGMMGSMPGMPFSPMFSPPKQKAAQLMVSVRWKNAVRVNACVPTDPWPGSTLPITPPTKIDENVS